MTLVFSRNRNRSVDRAIDRTVIRKDPMHALDRLLVFLCRGEVQRDMNALDDENPVFVFHFADDFGGELAAGRIDLARLQRASKGAEESAAGGGDEVVDGGGVRLRDRRLHAVVLGDRAMHTEVDRIRFRR